MVIDMSKSDRTAAIVDGVLRLTVTSGAIAAGLLIPNLLIGLEKPLDIFWKQLDKRERERELRRVVSYMKSRDLIHGDYEHGLVITEQGRERLKKIDFDNIKIESAATWDKKWRLVFYDIPESYKEYRQALARKLRNLGFYQLQKSAWVHPLPCRDVIKKICTHYEIEKYVSYVEIIYIDNQENLKKRFNNIF